MSYQSVKNQLISKQNFKCKFKPIAETYWHWLDMDKEDKIGKKSKQQFMS